MVHEHATQPGLIIELSPGPRLAHKLPRRCWILATLALAPHLGSPSALGAQDTPRWSLTETLRIGSIDDPATALTGVNGVRVSPNGLLFVGQPQEALVRVFDLVGSPIMTIGGRGEGPGEFGAIGGFGWIAERFYVIDPSLRRVSFFGAGGDFLEANSWLTPLFDDVFVARTPTQLLDDKLAIAFPTWEARRLAADMTRPYPVLLTTWDGTIVDTVTTTSVKHTQLTIERGTSMTHTSQPFGDSPLRAAGPDGAVYILDREVHETAGRGFYRLTKIEPNGDTVFVSETGFEPIPLPRGLRDSILFATAERLGRGRTGTSTRETEGKLRALMFLPEFYPPASRLRVGQDGKIWVRRESARSAQVARWDLLSPNGIRIAYFLLDTKTSIRDSAGGAVWTTVRDDLDVTYVVRSEVIRE